jgi:hypothetical protein
LNAQPGQGLQKKETSLVGTIVFPYIFPGDIPNSMDYPHNIDIFVDVSIG